MENDDHDAGNDAAAATATATRTMIVVSGATRRGVAFEGDDVGMYPPRLPSPLTRLHYISVPGQSHSK